VRVKVRGQEEVRVEAVGGRGGRARSPGVLDAVRLRQVNGKLQPHEVFTPNRAPLQEHQVYAAREEAEKTLRRAFRRRDVPVVIGEFGVGKTTLVTRFFRDEAEEGRFAHFASPADKNLENLAKVVLEQLGYSVEKSRETTSGSELGGEVGGGVFATLTAKLTGKLSQSDSRTEELVVTTPTDQGLLRLMNEARVILAIDEMHKASDGFRLQLAEMLKAVSTLNLDYPSVVVLGTTADATDLVREDEGIDRSVQEVRLEPMTKAESRFVVRDGMEKLQITIGDNLVEAIIQTAAGAPALLQGICLDVAEGVVDAGREEATRDELDAAVRNFLLQGQARLTQKYMTAVETVGPKRYRKQILHAMAESKNDYMTMDELTGAVGAALGEETPATALSGPLRELKSTTHGEVLRDVERPDVEDGTRVYNLTTFKDPRMKAFIRVMQAVGEQGLLPSEDEVEALPPAPEDE
jgi:GTPase SAR1 family protein